MNNIALMYVWAPTRGATTFFTNLITGALSDRKSRSCIITPQRHTLCTLRLTISGCDQSQSFYFVFC